MEQQLFTIDETAKILSLGKTKVYDYIKRNELTTVKLGKSRRVFAKSIEDFVQKRIVK